MAQMDGWHSEPLYGLSPWALEAPVPVISLGLGCGQAAAAPQTPFTGLCMAGEQLGTLR